MALNTSDRSNAYICLDEYSYTIMLSDSSQPNYVTPSGTALQRQESALTLKLWMMENFFLKSYVISVCFLIGVYNVRLLDLQDPKSSNISLPLYFYFCTILYLIYHYFREYLMSNDY